MPSQNDEEREKELDRYREIAAKIYEQNKGKYTPAELHASAKRTLTDITEVFPDGDPVMINSFMASVAMLVAHLLDTPLKYLPNVMEHTFDLNMLAIAGNLGVIDLNSEELSEEVKANIREAEEKLANEDQPMPDLGNIVGPYL
jgi:hypothetical protein